MRPRTARSTLIWEIPVKIIAYIKSIGREGGDSMSAAPVEFKEDYLQAYTLKSWLLTTDHKRIGLLYMAAITFFFFVGARPRPSCDWS